jgi:hypothetical protein
MPRLPPHIQSHSDADDGARLLVLAPQPSMPCSTGRVVQSHPVICIPVFVPPIAKTVKEVVHKG